MNSEAYAAILVYRHSVYIKGIAPVKILDLFRMVFESVKRKFRHHCTIFTDTD